MPTGGTCRDGRVTLFHSFATNLTTITRAATSPVYAHEGTVTAGVPVTLSPSTVKFGGVAVGILSAAKLVTIRNTSGNTVPLVGINLGGANPGQFTRASSCPGQPGPGAGCTVEVRFRPSSTGATTAKLIVNLGVDYPKVFTWLNGTGL